MDNATCQNTDLRIWRKTQDPLSPSIHVTQCGNIGINVGGRVIVMPVEKWHALGMIELGLDNAKPEQRYTTADLLDWAETLLCNSMPIPSCNQPYWHEKFKAWRYAKNAPPTMPYTIPSPTPDQTKEWISQIRRLRQGIIDASSPSSREFSLAIDTLKEAITHLEEKLASCDHASYYALPEPRPRHCSTCGAKMWDAGD